jgi:hypothetical protein
MGISVTDESLWSTYGRRGRRICAADLSSTHGSSLAVPRAYVAVQAVGLYPRDVLQRAPGVRLRLVQRPARPRLVALPHDIEGEALAEAYRVLFAHEVGEHRGPVWSVAPLALRPGSDELACPSD